MTEGRDVWWHDAVGTASEVHEPEAFDAETPLFIMYTSGTTGKPKGLVHTSGGYLTQASWSFEHLFSNPDPALRDEDVHWCTADLAWVTAHTYEIYGPLSNGVTQVIFEGTPEHPAPGPALRDHRTLRRHAVLHRAHPGPLPHGLVPGRRPGHATTSPPSGCSAPWARPSTPRPGAGCGTTSAPAPPPWWTPGGSPRPAPPSSPPPPRTPTSSPAARPARCPASAPGSWTTPATRCRRASRASSWWTPPAPRSPGPSGATRSATSIRTGASTPSRAGSSPATAPSMTTTATSGSSGGWMTPSTSPGHLLSTIEIESALVSHPDVVEAGVCPVADPKTGHAIVAFVVLKASACYRGHRRRAPQPRREGDRPDRQAARRRRRSRCAEDPQRQDHAPAADPTVRRHRARRHHLAPERTVHRGHPGRPARPRRGSWPATPPGSKGTPMTDISNVARLSEPLKFAYWVPNVSGGLVVSTIEQRTGWDFDYNKKLARIAENSGFEYALTQTRYAASYGADKQHEATSLQPGAAGRHRAAQGDRRRPPGHVAPRRAGEVHHHRGPHLQRPRRREHRLRLAQGEFENFGLEWLEHDERYVRTEEFIRVLRGLLTEQELQPVRQVLQHHRLHPAAGAGGRARPGPPGDLLRRQLHRRAGHRRPGG